MIEFTTGEVTTSGNGSLSLYTFYRRELSSKEAPIHLAESDSQSGLRSGKENIVEVVPSGSPRIKKSWTTRRIAPPPGAIFKFVIRRSKPHLAFGATMAAIIVRTRDSAPLQRIEIDVPWSEGCTKSKVYIEGRFDRITLDEFIEQGYAATSSEAASDLQQLEVAEDADYINVVVLEKAIAPSAKASTVKIGNKSITKVRRRRRIVTGT